MPLGVPHTKLDRAEPCDDDGDGDDVGEHIMIMSMILMVTIMLLVVKMLMITTMIWMLKSLTFTTGRGFAVVKSPWDRNQSRRLKI